MSRCPLVTQPWVRVCMYACCVVASVCVFLCMHVVWVFVCGRAYSYRKVCVCVRACVCMCEYFVHVFFCSCVCVCVCVCGSLVPPKQPQVLTSTSVRVGVDGPGGHAFREAVRFRFITTLVKRGLQSCSRAYSRRAAVRALQSGGANNHWREAWADHTSGHSLAVECGHRQFRVRGLPQCMSHDLARSLYVALWWTWRPPHHPPLVLTVISPPCPTELSVRVVRRVRILLRMNTHTP